MVIFEFRLCQLLSARICHDLIAPVSNLNNCLELAVDDFPLNSTTRLIKSTALEIERKLVFFRAAFGNGKLQDEFIDFRKVSLIIKNFLEIKNITLCLDSKIFSQPIKCSTATLLYNIVFLTSEVAPRGGKTCISLDNTRNFEIINISIKGKLVLLKHEVEKALLEDIAIHALTPQTIQAYLTRSLANNVGLKWILQQKSKSILSFTLTNR